MFWRQTLAGMAGSGKTKRMLVVISMTGLKSKEGFLGGDLVICLEKAEIKIKILVWVEC